MTMKTYIELIEQRSGLTESMFHSDSDTGHLFGEMEKLNAMLDAGEYHGMFEIKHVGPDIRKKLRSELNKLKDNGYDLEFHEITSLLTSTFVVHCELKLAHTIVEDVFKVLKNK